MRHVCSVLGFGALAGTLLLLAAAPGAADVFRTPFLPRGAGHVRPPELAVPYGYFPSMWRSWPPVLKPGLSPLASPLGAAGEPRKPEVEVLDVMPRKVNAR